MVRPMHAVKLNIVLSGALLIRRMSLQIWRLEKQLKVLLLRLKCQINKLVFALFTEKRNGSRMER